MKHDPERNVATYLSGEMSRRRRNAFEEHILECEDCWQEVDVGRRGRATAEAGRELAPQPLRERVRLTVSAAPPRERRWRWPLSRLSGVIAAALVVASVAGFFLLLAPAGQPREIDLLLADFRGETSLGSQTASRLPRQLGDLRLRHSKTGRVDGMEFVAHSYVDPAGHEVVVYQADETFPVARGAEHSETGDTWTARAHGAVLFCADHPVPSLVIGDDQQEVALAASELGLQ